MFFLEDLILAIITDLESCDFIKVEDKDNIYDLLDEIFRDYFKIPLDKPFDMYYNKVK